MQVLTFRKYRLLYSVLLTCALVVLPAYSSPVKEYQIKAVFLFNFTQFAEWPSGSFPSAGSSFIIGVLGSDPFGAYLDETTTGERSNGHPIVIQRYTNPEDVKGCHLLFIHSSEVSKMDLIRSNLKGKSTLTVSESPDFIKAGGMINFIKENNKIHFQINPEAAKKSNIIISSKLLRLAQIVVPKK